MLEVDPFPDLKARVCLGGTFDIFHKGHEALLSRAVLEVQGLADSKLVVAITADDFASSYRKRQVAPYSQRAERVADFLEKHDCPYSIVPLEDTMGPARYNTMLQRIVVSRESKNNAHSINEHRIKNGLDPLKIIVIDMVRNVSGEPICATRLREKIPLE